MGKDRDITKEATSITTASSNGKSAGTVQVKFSQNFCSNLVLTFVQTRRRDYWLIKKALSMANKLLLNENH
jgi:hypothetical protein